MEFTVNNKAKEFMKNIPKAEVVTLKEQVAYQDGQVVSKTLAQNDALSVTLFSFDKGEEISAHTAAGDAFVTCLDGTGKITIDWQRISADRGAVHRYARRSPSRSIRRRKIQNVAFCCEVNYVPSV